MEKIIKIKTKPFQTKQFMTADLISLFITMCYVLCVFLIDEILVSSLSCDLFTLNCNIQRNELLTSIVP